MAPQKKSDSHYVITYRDPRDGKICTLKARKIHDSTLGLSFVSISEFIFETTSTVLNPTEEALQTRFANIKSFHLSIYSIISIEEVGEKNQGLKFAHNKSNLVVLPSTDSPKS